MQFLNLLAAKRKRNLAAFRLLGGNVDWIADNTPRVLYLATVQGAINGINTLFTVSPMPSGGVLVFVNGVFQIKDICFTLAGNTITFAQGYVPQFRDVLDVIVQVNP